MHITADTLLRKKKSGFSEEKIVTHFRNTTIVLPDPVKNTSVSFQCYEVLEHKIQNELGK